MDNGYSGQYGTLAGANVNYVTKSGSNNFHGQMFGPIELNPTTDVLTKMIGAMEGQLATLESKIP